MTTDCLPLNPDEYVQNPNFCPVCGLPEITGHQAEFDADYAWRSITCDACDAEWHDLYTMTGYELVVEPA
jgi:formate dehydrogenase maturation protein FdhE